jgi:hypothetical protein
MHKGIIGEQWDESVKKYYQGGANQYELWYTVDNLGNPIWNQYSKRTGNEVTLQ